MQSDVPVDPPVRSDGRCTMCGGLRFHRPMKALYMAALAGDPFCSTECARAWWDCSLPTDPRRPVKRGYE